MVIKRGWKPKTRVGGSFKVVRNILKTTVSNFANRVCKMNTQRYPLGL
jgi:hypothetical protein